MADIVRWVLLGLLFTGLVGAWIWSKRQASLRRGPGAGTGLSLRVLQRRGIDQRTGVVLVEAENQSFLLAYTVGGSVSWQPLEKAKAPEPKPASRFETDHLLAEIARP